MEKNFDLATFQKITDNMIARNADAYGGGWTDRYSYSSRRTKDYTIDEIKKIIESGSLSEQRRLSRNYYYKDGFYKRILIYYATLLKYCGILIPNPSFGKKLSDTFIQKKYYKAMDFVENMHIPDFLTKCALRALIDGTYYGAIQRLDKKHFSTLDLPVDYCRSRFKDEEGNDVIEFNVSYFDTIIGEDNKKTALAVYPDVISDYYELYKNGKTVDRWVIIPSEIGICFPMLDGIPSFLNIIPATIDYDESVLTEKERDKEEIRKVIVQKIPHLNDGQLLFEPIEAEEMHRGAVGMMKGNKNVSVLTTYADVDSIVSKTSAETASNNLEKMMKNVFYEAGVSNQLFASDSNLSLETSIKNDAAMMMTLVHTFENFITNIVNKVCANTNINFKYTILPVTYYNEDKFIDSSFKLANSGYSFIIPAVAMGISQRDLGNLKDLENDVLKLADKLIPLSSAFTQSGGVQGRPGAPEKPPEEKSQKTIQNQQSLDKGGSN